MKQILTLTLMVCCLALSSQAKAQDIVAHVEGMVCDFCARGLEKTFGKINEVEAVAVSLEQGTVTIDMKEGYTIPDATITKLIQDNGVTTTKIERSNIASTVSVQPIVKNPEKSKKRGFFDWFKKD